MKDSIEFDKSKPIRVIKNGNHASIEKQIIEGKATILKNTCAYDLFAYLALFAAHDFSHIKKMIILKNVSLFNTIVFHIFMSALIPTFDFWYKSGTLLLQ